MDLNYRSEFRRRIEQRRALRRHGSFVFDRRSRSNSMGFAFDGLYADVKDGWIGVEMCERKSGRDLLAEAWNGEQRAKASCVGSAQRVLFALAGILVELISSFNARLSRPLDQADEERNDRMQCLSLQVGFPHHQR
ncbi:hypothetical protein E5676_scaffold1032G00420 [Cucumis melo var. makuwa]|uniref:Uncharacterized protein n=1 Tax=Cucumis melo var. makuwa TaxID=1194695 RepID=A0A5D3D0S4_CUCMM|nr:hypothetical protein E5676_scaffold1032G00420 [Cucumis melo var. makuwa]